MNFEGYNYSRMVDSKQSKKLKPNVLPRFDSCQAFAGKTCSTIPHTRDFSLVLNQKTGFIKLWRSAY